MNLVVCERTFSPLEQRVTVFEEKLKSEGIDVECGVTPGGCSIRISSLDWASPFGEYLDHAIKKIAIDLGYTGVGGKPINVHKRSDPHTLFFFPA